MGTSIPEQSVPTIKGDARPDGRLACDFAGGDPPLLVSVLEALFPDEIILEGRPIFFLCKTLTVGTLREPYTLLHNFKASDLASSDVIRRYSADGLSSSETGFRSPPASKIPISDG